MEDMKLFEAMHSCRALRRFSRTSVPDDVLAKILEAAIQAPSAGNGQNWLFMVVKDEDQKRKLGDIYHKAGAMVAGFYARAGRPVHMNEGQWATLAGAGLYLHEHLADAPVLIVACLRLESSVEVLADLPRETQLAMINSFAWMAGASIYPAVQNLILACRALGLGTCLTTNHMLFEEEIKTVLGLPAEYRTFALLPIGYPLNKFGPVKRRPLSEVVVLDRWGQAPKFG